MKLREMTSAYNERIHGAWSRLSNRDQNILRLSLPIMLAILLYLFLFSPIWERYNQSQKKYQQLQTNLEWLWENASRVQRLNSSCSPNLVLQRPDAFEARDYAQDILTLLNAKAALRQVNDTNLVLDWKNVAGNTALKLLHTLHCHGFELSQSSLKQRQLKTKKTAATNKKVTSAETNRIDLSVRLTLSPWFRGREQ